MGSCSLDYVVLEEEELRFGLNNDCSVGAFHSLTNHNIV